MHALATAKAGSLGDERYISYSLFVELFSEGPVSYTHLTLPTILLV